MNISLNFAERAGVSVNHPPCCRVCNDTCIWIFISRKNCVMWHIQNLISCFHVTLADMDRSALFFFR